MTVVVSSISAVAIFVFHDLYRLTSYWIFSGVSEVLPPSSILKFAFSLSSHLFLSIYIPKRYLFITSCNGTPFSTSDNLVNIVRCVHKKAPDNTSRLKFASSFWSSQFLKFPLKQFQLATPTKFKASIQDLQLSYETRTSQREKLQQLKTSA